MAEPAGVAPLGFDAFEACLAPLLSKHARGVVIAVSGGPDSICLMRLVAELHARGALPAVAVATVDHGLRAGSRSEADFVLAEAAAVGLPAHRLTWTGPKPARARQEKARTARYGLLADLCAQIGADHLLTAHTLDDQAETVLFRLARGSGPTGLAGMRSVTRLGRDVSHLRPLLGIPKDRLVATCRARGWQSVRDPSNEDPGYARTRLRRLLPSLAAEGLDAMRLARLAQRLQRAEAALDHATDLIGREAVNASAPDLWQIDLGRIATLPAEYAVRLIGRALRERIPDRPVRLDRLEQATEASRHAVSRRAGLARTLHGCLLVLSPEGILTIRPEPPRRRGTVAAQARDRRPAPAPAPVKRAHRRSLGKGDRDPYIAG